MSLLKKLLPKGFLWRLSVLNILVIASAIAVSGWAIYNTACFLVEGMGDLNAERQQQFNHTLFQYLWIFSFVGIAAGSILHFYLTKKLIKPLRRLIDSMKRMKKGEYPNPIHVESEDEVGQLVGQFNELIHQLHSNDQQRQKLVTDLSHEIRTPLANLSGYLSALKSGDIKGDEQLFQSLYQESYRLTQMVEQLDQLKEWDYLQSQSLSEKQPVDIAEQINQCVAMFDWTLTQKEIPIKVEADSAIISFHVEGIQQVISNLLDNAIRYYQGNEAIVIKGIKQDSGYHVSVTGHGTSIPSEEMDRIFERFYRIDISRSRETGGSGLGLAIAKEIVEYHEGEIGVRAEGNRNCFWFRIP